MEKKEIKKFAELSMLYDQVCETYVWDHEKLITIEKLYCDNEFQAIASLYNEDEYEDGGELFENTFGYSHSIMNELADKFGIERVKQ